MTKRPDGLMRYFVASSRISARNERIDDLFDKVGFDLRLFGVRGVPSGQYDGVDALRLVVIVVFDGHLTLGIGTQVWD